MKLLLEEIKKFSRQNWWIYIIFLICLSIIWYTEKGSILEVSLVFFAHFIGDLLVMMMGEYYSKKQFQHGAISHILSNFTFMLIGLYAVFYTGEWQYFLPTFAFMMGGIKTYFLQVKSKEIKFLNVHSVLLMNFIIFLIYIYFGLFGDLYSYIQFFGFVIGSTGLIIQDNKKRYFYYVLGTFLIALGSFIGIYVNYLDGIILGTSISYFLLPLTVVVFYLKNIRKYMK